MEIGGGVGVLGGREGSLLQGMGCGEGGGDVNLGLHKSLSPWRRSQLRRLVGCLSADYHPMEKSATYTVRSLCLLRL